jgi:hypothetical protein
MDLQEILKSVVRRYKMTIKRIGRQRGMGRRKDSLTSKQKLSKLTTEVIAWRSHNQK